MRRIWWIIPLLGLSFLCLAQDNLKQPLKKADNTHAQTALARQPNRAGVLAPAQRGSLFAYTLIDSNGGESVTVARLREGAAEEVAFFSNELLVSLNEGYGIRVTELVWRHNSRYLAITLNSNDDLSIVVVFDIKKIPLRPMIMSRNPRGGRDVQWLEGDAQLIYAPTLIDFTPEEKGFYLVDVATGASERYCSDYFISTLFLKGKSLFFVGIAESPSGSLGKSSLFLHDVRSHKTHLILEM